MGSPEPGTRRYTVLRFLLRRLLWSAVSLFLFLAIVYFGISIVMPYDWASQFALYRTHFELELMRRLLGLDLPLWKQYVVWLGNVLTGRLGQSFSGIPVVSVLESAVPPTLLVFVIGMVLAFLLGRWLGKVVSWRRPGRSPAAISGAVTLGAVALYTAFPPFLALLMRHFFAPGVHRLRALLGLDFSSTMWHSSPLSEPRVIFYILVTFIGVLLILAGVNGALRRLSRRRVPWILQKTALVCCTVLVLLGAVRIWHVLGFGPQALDVVVRALLPLATFVLLFFGETMLITRTAMADTLQEEYISAARAKGLRERAVRDRHAARNAALPVLSRLVISLPYILTGLIIVEREVLWSGIGERMFNAVYTQDMPLVMGILLVVGAICLAARLALEITYAALEPRIRVMTEAPLNAGNANSRRVISADPLQTLRRRLSRHRSRQFQQRQSRSTGRAAKRAKDVSLWRRITSLRRQVRRWALSTGRQLSAAWEAFVQTRLAVVGLVLVAVFGIMALTSPVLRATVWRKGMYDPTVGHDVTLLHPSPPSTTHLLGTDALGRDVLSMLLAATGSEFALGLTAAVTAAVVGVTIGGISAYCYGRFIDGALSFLADGFLLLPAPLFMVIVGARYSVDIGPVQFGLIYGVLSGVSGATIVIRSQALKLMASPFIEACRVAGGGARHIIFHHLVPHLLPMAALYMMLTVTGAVVADGFVAYFGLTRTYLNWGSMIYSAITFYWLRGDSVMPWHALIPPAVALSLFAASFYLISRGLHTVAEPRLRRL
jgi:ABC-type dipeptide/oligopeptide/nickel transport system permease component